MHDVLPFPLYIYLDVIQRLLFVGDNFAVFVLLVKLADKQAALERLGWEANMSNRKSRGTSRWGCLYGHGDYYTDANIWRYVKEKLESIS